MRLQEHEVGDWRLLGLVPGQTRETVQPPSIKGLQTPNNIQAAPVNMGSLYYLFSLCPSVVSPSQLYTSGELPVTDMIFTLQVSLISCAFFHFLFS